MRNSLTFDITVMFGRVFRNRSAVSAKTYMAVVGAVCFMLGGIAQASEEANQLDGLASLVGGTWIYEGVDEKGDSVVDRQVFEWTLDHHFIKLQQANRSRNGDYITETTVGWDADNGELVFWNFTNFGEVYRGVVSAHQGRSVWEARSLDLETVLWRASIEMLDENRTRHTIKVREDDGSWVELHTWVYHREIAITGDSELAPPKTGLAVHIEAIVDAPPAAVFPLWLSETGIKQFFAPAALIEPRIGGRYEMIFSPENDPDGSSLGTQGAQILMMVENEFLAFEWPSFIAWQSPEGGGPPVAPMLRSQRPIPTWVGVRFEPLEGQPNRTRVTLSHYGFQNGEIWDESRKYFWTAWPSVLGRLGSIFVTDGQAVAANDQ